MSNKTSKSAKTSLDPLSSDYGVKIKNKANEKTPYETPESSSHKSNK